MLTSRLHEDQPDTTAYEAAVTEYESALKQAEYQETCLRLAQERLNRASTALAYVERSPGHRK